MSIPQICPSCGNHISTAHAADCCYGTPEYTHLGWPSYSTTGDGIALISTAHPTHTHTITMEELSKNGYFSDNAHATAIRRLLDYLKEEPESDDIVGEMAPNFAAITLLKKRSEELRKEAAGISLVESRAKRNFAADILDGLISELTE